MYPQYFTKLLTIQYYNMTNRINESEEIVFEKDLCDESYRIPTHRNSPPSNLINDKSKPKQAQVRKLKRNISQDSKSSARGQKSRKIEEREEPLKRRDGSEMNQIYKQLFDLTTKYKTLKDSYNCLIKEKMETNKTTKSNQDEIVKLSAQNSELRKQNQMYRYQVQHLQKELERIKKQSVKMIEVQTYKMKRLEENIKEKQRIIASRNESSLSFCHDDIAFTEVKEYSHRGNICQPIYSYREKYTNINTEIVDQKMIYATEEQPTIQCTLDNVTNRDYDKDYERRRERSSESSISSGDILPVYQHKTKQFELFKKKNPFDTINECKSPNQKKKRSITNGKSNTGKKKPMALVKGPMVKTKKTNNQTFR